MRTLLSFILAAIVAGSTAPAIAQPADAWDIGPVIRGRNYSVGMPPSPAPARGGWSFEFPYADARAGHVHYVTTDLGPLAGKRRIVVRYKVEAARGVRFVPQEHPGESATVSLVFQRRGDSWSGRRHPFHRWYAPPQTLQAIAPGVHEMAVSLDDPQWISVFGKPAATAPEGYAAALAQTGRIGLVFGSAGARGHGVYATGPARFTLLDFRIE